MALLTCTDKYSIKETFNMANETFNTITTTEIISDSSLTLTTGTSPTTIRTNSKRVVTFEGRVTDGTAGEAPQYDIHTVRGSIDAPEVLEPGDFGSSLRFTTFLDGGSGDIGKSLAVLMTQMDPSATKTDVAPASNFAIILSAGDGKGSLPDGDYHAFEFNHTGTLVTQAVKLATVNVSNMPPEPGTMVYNKETDKFQGYVKDAGNGQPGWINLH